jgi:hypothetical protein
MKASCSLICSSSSDEESEEMSLLKSKLEALAMSVVKRQRYLHIEVINLLTISS